MRRRSRMMRRLISGHSDANIRFNDLCALLRRLGFDEHIRGSHHTFRKLGVERIGLQRSGSDAKPYQVRQVRRIVMQYQLEEL